MDSRSEFFMKLWFPKELRSCLDKALKSKPQTSFLNLPTVTVSFRSYLHRCFAGKVFKFRHVNNSSPVAWATSRSRSNESPRELGEDTRKPPPRPPSEVEVIVMVITQNSTSFCSTQTLWQHDLRLGLGWGLPESQLVRVRNSLSRLITSTTGCSFSRSSTSSSRRLGQEADAAD